MEIKDWLSLYIGKKRKVLSLYNQINELCDENHLSAFVLYMDSTDELYVDDLSNFGYNYFSDGNYLVILVQKYFTDDYCIEDTVSIVEDNLSPKIKINYQQKCSSENATTPKQKLKILLTEFYDDYESITHALHACTWIDRYETNLNLFNQTIDRLNNCKSLDEYMECYFSNIYHFSDNIFDEI